MKLFAVLALSVAALFAPVSASFAQSAAALSDTEQAAVDAVVSGCADASAPACAPALAALAQLAAINSAVLAAPALETVVGSIPTEVIQAALDAAGITDVTADEVVAATQPQGPGQGPGQQSPASPS